MRLALPGSLDRAQDRFVSSLRDSADGESRQPRLLLCLGMKAKQQDGQLGILVPAELRCAPERQ
jgi:hypothetical protein